MPMKIYIFIVLLVGVAFGQLDSSYVLINEFLAGSETCCGTEIFDGNAEDFVELYNNGADTVNISGWGFSDTDGIITTIAPDTSIAPGDFLVLWYTGDNNGFPEVNEKLSKNGETIYIADADGSPVVSYDFGSQTDDLSYGRNPDGSAIWEYFPNPNPGQSNVIENTSLSIDGKIVPEAFVLHKNYPNPFNPVTSLRYNLPNDGLVNITIYDMRGRLIKTLLNSSQTAGYKTSQWNATNDRNEPVSAGLYLYAIQTGEFRQTRKMVLLK